MKYFFLLIGFYAGALFLSLELRPIFYPPPGSLKDAKAGIVGTWTGTEGIGHFEMKDEIEFREDWTYALHTSGGDEDWNVRTGFYSIDTTRDTPARLLTVTVSLGGMSRGATWYFKNCDKLYPRGRGIRFTKNSGIADGLVWYIFLPCLMASVPFIIVRKKNHHAERAPSDRDRAGPS